MLAQQAQNNMQTKPSELQKWGNFSLNYLKQLPPLAISTTIGALTGGICAHVLQKSEYSPMELSLPLIFAWIIEISVRNAAMRQTDKDLDKQNIKHDKDLMFGMAYLASWLTYLKMSGHLPFLEIEFKK